MKDHLESLGAVGLGMNALPTLHSLGKQHQARQPNLGGLSSGGGERSVD